MREPSRDESFSRFFFAGVAFRIGLTIGVMALAYAGAAVGDAIGNDWPTFGGAVLGLAAGVLMARVVKRRWDPLDRTVS